MQMIVLVLALIISLGLTGAMRRYALSNSVIDTPSERSSHKIATPTGGGLGFVLPFLLGLLVFWQLGHLSEIDIFVLAPAGGVLALVGFWDDHSPLSPLIRFVVQLCSCAWVVYGYDFHHVFEEGGEILTSIACILALGWLVNLYNFMDGIDGIASVEAVSVIAGWIIISIVFGGRPVLVPILLATSVLGFLFWNFPPARIFMGDCGSVFIGLILGAIAVKSAALDLENLFIWAILLGVFVVDASVTLARRLIRRENPLSPHRTHAYQILAVLLKSHKVVTLRVGLINLLWLTPIALGVASGIYSGWVGLIVAYLPLVALVLVVGAGGRRFRLSSK